MRIDVKVGLYVCGKKVMNEGIVFHFVSKLCFVCSCLKNKFFFPYKRKISLIGTNVGIIDFGVEQGIEQALLCMNDNKIENATSPLEIMREIERSASIGWSYFLSRLAPDVDRSHESLRVGFLAGGYIRSETTGGFICGVLFHPEDHDKPLIQTRENGFIVLGGEREGSQILFKENAQREYDLLETPGTGVMNNIVNAFLRAGISTIKEISESNPQIGGTIRYMVIRRSYPIVSIGISKKRALSSFFNLGKSLEYKT